MNFQTRLTVLLLLLLFKGALAQDWQGTWNTTFGPIRLYEFAGYVAGDYGDRGLILGKKQFDLVQGVFTNPGKERGGYFTFQAVGNNKFRGSYRWNLNGSVADWNGDKVSGKVPTLRNFHNLSFTPSSDGRDGISGTYNTTYGQIKLLARDGLLVGDYGGKGVLIGGWDRNNYSGHFTNNGRLGWFRFYFTPAGQFNRGEWGWFPKEKTGAWTLQKVNSVTPVLSQVVPPNSSTTAAIDARQEETRPPANNSNGTRPSQPQAPPALPWTLYPESRFNARKVETMAGMQQHVQWISQARESEVLDSLGDAGYEVENGGRLITSELSGKLAGMVTTDRLRSYVAVRGNDVVVCFRGSKAKHGEKWDFARLKTILNGMVDDANVLPIPPNFIGSQSKDYREGRAQRVHAGFSASYTRLRPKIISALSKHRGKNLYIFGHSLGGAQATMCGLDVALNLPGYFPNETVIVSGSPRVGDASFKRFYERHVPNIYRLEVVGDPVTMVPPSVSFNNYTYIHLGDLVHIDGNGRVVHPSDISKKVRFMKASNHDNEYYFDAVDDLWTKSKVPGFFNDKGNYTREANRAERSQSLSDRVNEKLRFWE